MVIDYYTRVGYALELLSRSTHHRRFHPIDYACTHLFEPLELDQCRYYLDETGVPVAMATWAWITKDVESEILVSGRALETPEWNAGGRLFFNDWIAPYGNVRALIGDLKENVFPNHIGRSVRRHPDLSVRKVNRWIGVNAGHGGASKRRSA